MPHVYRIVPAAPGHLRAVPKIEQAAASVFAAEDLPPELRYRVTDRELLREAQRDGRLWVALAAAGPVGFALAEIADGQAFLAELDVHPEHARQGLGTRLVGAVLDWAAARRCASVSLVTFRHLPWNAPFYERLGFVPVPAHEIGPELRKLVDEETAAGIDAAKRLAMRRPLPGGMREETA